MQDHHISNQIQNLVEIHDHFGKEKFDLDEELAGLIHPVTKEPIDEESRKKIEKGVLDRLNYKRSHDGAILVPVSVVATKEHEDWYEDWFPVNNDDSKSYYWKRLEDFLARELTKKNGPENAAKVVKSIDNATYTIMTKLANPNRSEFSYKGLVVGYVQSGKTANFTALIAKATDAGYKIIIVLAGIHNVLRRQTQVRLDRELTGQKDIETDDVYIDLPGAAKKWNRLTAAQNDFTTTNLSQFEDYCRYETPTLAVVKKNVSVLNSLISYISKASPASLAEVPVLIIDDEADQASIDTNANTPDTDPTQTNICIRTLLKLFKKKAYVGYTATPFANVLIDMAADHPVYEDDLYPRNFIISLPEPDKYFGPSKIFQGELSDNFVQEITDDANELIRRNEITEHLSVAVDQFLLSCAIRNLRGDKEKPMSMLVHTSHRINYQTVIAKIISDYLSETHKRFKKPSEKKSLEKHFKETWNILAQNADEINKGLLTGNVIPKFEEVWIELENVFPVVRTIELNSSSEDRLDYTRKEEIKVIAVGGNQLSRGLTLEGLMTSYYLRASRQYDTLLQMGRWFGYRNGYEDLTRIHTTSQIWDFFEHLALVEQELRSAIARYEDEDLTPLEMAVAIRDHRNLTVTARNKMGAGAPKQVSYSDSLNQTIWLPLDDTNKLRANYNLGDAFIKSLNDSAGLTFRKENNAFVTDKKVKGETVLFDFLNKYTYVTPETAGGPGLDSDNLLAYIYRRMNEGELTEWNVAVATNISSKSGSKIEYGGLEVNRIQRSRKNTLKGFNIGVLTDPNHLTLGTIQRGTDHIRTEPLLVLYLIWNESKTLKPNTNPLVESQRVDLFKNVKNEGIDVLGIGIALPKSSLEPNSYFGQ